MTITVRVKDDDCEAKMLAAARETLLLIEAEQDGNDRELKRLVDRQELLDRRKLAICAMLEEFEDVKVPEKPVVGGGRVQEVATIPGEAVDDGDVSEALVQPSGRKPDGLPTTHKMVCDAIRALGSAASANAIADEMRPQWPGVSGKRLLPQLIGMVNEGRLHRAGRGVFDVKPPIVDGATLASPARSEPPPPEEKRPEPRLAPRADGETFQFNGASCIVSSLEKRLLDKMVPTIGKGFLECKPLAAHVAGRTIDAAFLYLDDMRRTLNPKIAPFGLALEPFNRAGFFLKSGKAA